MCVDNQVYVEFHPPFFCIKDPSTQKIITKHGLSQIESSGTLKYKQSSQSLNFGILSSHTATLTTELSDIWHSRLYHPSIVICSKVREQSDLGILKLDTTQQKYVVCPFSKAHRLPFVSTSVNAKETFVLIYADLWTSPSISVNGVKYFLLLVDDHSRFIGIYFLATKDQCKLAINLFKIMAERQFDRKIKSIQSDGGEFSLSWVKIRVRCWSSSHLSTYLCTRWYGGKQRHKGYRGCYNHLTPFTCFNNILDLCL